MISHHLETIWDFLTQPAAAIEDIYSQRRARTISAVLLALIVLGTIIFALGMLVEGGIENLITSKAYVGQLRSDVILFAVYLFSRTRYYKFAGITMLFIITALIFEIIVVGHDPLSRNLFMISLLVLLATFFLTTKESAVVTVILVVAEAILIYLIVDFADPIAADEAASVFIVQGFFIPPILVSGIVRERTEKQVQEFTTELIEQNYELEAFAHTVAHDLKGSLQVISINTEMLGIKSKSLSEAELQLQVQKIKKSIKKSTQIINDLLLLAESRQGEVEVHPLEMREIIDEAISRLSYLTEGRDVQFTIPDTLPSVMGHDQWVEEIWLNYLSNAIKYGGSSPQITLGADMQKKNYIRFWVRDKGAGMSSEEQAALFYPFSRVKEHPIKGHGLGLSIVERIVTKLGGEVTAESVSGEGSTFSFTLPAA